VHLFLKRGAEEFLFYTVDGNWLVGHDKSDPAGWCKVESGAMTPGAITEA
jgi:hypothetical protein